MIKYLPEHLRESLEVCEIISAFDKAHLTLDSDISTLSSQVFVNSATFGLSYFENMLGIYGASHLSDEVRRSKILAKMRSTGTTTLSTIKRVASAFTDGEILIDEHFSDYSFDITFKDGCLPSDFVEFTLAINEIKPAHLGFYSKSVQNYDTEVCSGVCMLANRRNHYISVTAGYENEYDTSVFAGAFMITEHRKGVNYIE